MNKSDILNTIKLVREFSKKRKFIQSFDLIVNINSNIKTNPIEFYTQLSKKKSKKFKICALIDKDLSSQAKEVFDTIILKDNFDKYKDKKKLKLLAKEHAFFIAQADIMPQIASIFGKVLGPKGKMPNPKAGCVIPPKIANLKPIYDKLQNTIKLAAKVEPIIKCSIGQEDMKDEDLAENISIVYNHLAQSLPAEALDIGSVFLKTTMSPSIKIGATKKEVEEKLKQKQEQTKKGPKKKDEEKLKQEPVKKDKKEKVKDGIKKK